MAGGSALFGVIAMAACALALMALEAFIPGVSLAGLAGLALVAVAAYLCWNAFGPTAAILLLACFGGLSFLVMRLIYRSMKNGRLSKSGIFMSEGGVPAVQALNHAGQIKVGQTGLAKTSLRPAGIAEFNEQRLHASATGSFIEAGEHIRVVRIEGSRIFVESIPKDESVPSTY